MVTFLFDTLCILQDHFTAVGFQCGVPTQQPQYHQETFQKCSPSVPLQTSEWNGKGAQQFAY